MCSSDLLHHIPDVRKHFDVISQTLKPGDKVVYFEPNWNYFSRFIYYFFHPEVWDGEQKVWAFESPDPMFSNQALPWILFVRDRSEFEQDYPELSVHICDSMNGLAFLLSGGVFRRTKVPSSFLIKLDKIESKSKLWMNFFGLGRMILIHRKIGRAHV